MRPRRAERSWTESCTCPRHGPRTGTGARRPASVRMWSSRPNGPGGGLAALGVVARQDVGRAARDRGDVVDRADLRHPFAVALLTFGQPGGELRVGVGGGLRGRWPERVRAHHDALTRSG